MAQIPWWGVISSGAAPVLLGGGLVLAESLQPAGYNAVHDTISALAAHGATDRGVMTAALAGLGTCHVVTAVGLHPVARAGRLMLGAGGLATVLVAVFAQPSHGNSVAHTVAAAIAFIALGAWPLAAAGPAPAAPLLRRPASVAAAIALLGLVVWFAAEIHGGQRGLAERAAAGAQALWPLAVVVTTRRALIRGVGSNADVRE